MKYIRVFYLSFFLLAYTCITKVKEPDLEQTIKTTNEEPYNLLDYTEDFSDQTWQRTNAFVEENVMASPLQRISADLLDLSKDKEQSRIAQVVPNLEKGTYAFSIYLKAVPGMSGNHAINLHSKGGKNSFKSTLVSVDDMEWIRAVVEVIHEDFGDIIVYPGNKQIKSSQLDKVYIWGAQLEKIQESQEEIKPYQGRSVIDKGLWQIK